MKVTKIFVIVLAVAFSATSAFAMSATEYTKRIVEVQKGTNLEVQVSKTFTTTDNCNRFHIETDSQSYINKTTKAEVVVLDAYISQTEIYCEPSKTPRTVSVTKAVVIDKGLVDKKLTLFIPAGYQVEISK